MAHLEHSLSENSAQSSTMLDWTSTMTIKLIGPAYQRETYVCIAQVEKLILEKWKITIPCRQMYNTGEAEIAVSWMDENTKVQFLPQGSIKIHGASGK
jgi:hypothetical protein